MAERLPEPFGLKVRYWIARALFVLVYRVFGLRRRVIHDNLARSFPERSAEELRAIRNEFIVRQSEMLAELDYARRLGPDELRKRVQLIDPVGLIASDVRLVMVGAHQCNFEWLLLRLSLELGSGMVGVYKPLQPAWADRYFLAIRGKFGAQLLPSKSIREEMGTIRTARALGLIADQVPRTSPERHWTTFLHQRTAFFTGPERMARLLRAPVVYIAMRRHARGQYEIEAQQLTQAREKLSAGEATERYARALERDIAADPAGWWWSHQRWKPLKDKGRVRAPSAGSGGDDEATG